MSFPPIPDIELRRFARLAAPLLHGAAARGYGPRATGKHPGPGLEYLDTRRYEPGDDVRSIDWRQSARRRTLLMRRYRDETAADWLLCVDGSASMAWGGRKWPLTAQVASALAYTLLYAGHRVGLVLFSTRLDALCDLGRGPRQYAAVLGVLRDHEPVAGSTGGGRMSNLGLCVPRLAGSSNAFVLSDFLEPDAMRPDLRSMRARASGVSAIQVLDTDEVTVPVSGPMALRDSETLESCHVSMSASVTRHAAATLRSHSQGLRQACARLGIRFTSCRTGQHWQQVLLDHLRR